MSQEQPRRSVHGADENQTQPIKYGDVFPVVGDLADKTIAPRDAAMMHSAENKALGHAHEGGPAAVMESSAMRNEQHGHVGHDQFSPITAKQGVSVTQTEIPDSPDQRLVTEFVACQTVGQHMVSAEENRDCDVDENDGGKSLGGVSTWTDKITIGEALEAAARAAGDRPVEMSDAAAIEAAESAATGLMTVLRGGIAATSQSAAAINPHVAGDEGKIKVADVLQDAGMRLPDDKEVTRQDAERVLQQEMRNNPEERPRPGGVAEAVVDAAQLNQQL